ncbi:hypothetical protein MKX01_037763 [Papaver californicum]|nr:hypothetical protein MKX01_037763 [Papaver californicum]
MDPLRNSFNPNKSHHSVQALIVLRHYVCSKGLSDPLHAMKKSSKKDKDRTIDGRSWRIYMSTLVVDLLFIVLPTLLFLTVLAEWTNICAICLILLLLFCIGDKRWISG